MPSWREDYLYRLTQSAGTEEQVFTELANIMSEIGFEYCSLGVRSPVVGRAPRESWSTTYPPDWQSLYHGQNYMTIDPVINAALRSPVPICWSDKLFTHQRPFWEEARAHGVCHGWTLAMHGRCGEMGLISLARSATSLSAAELDETEAKLVWVSHAANGVIANLAAQKNAPKMARDLTEREREVLRWTSLGKTSSEIGIILGITTRTINFHVTTILVKLDAVNKTQAVVKAVMLDLMY